MSHPRDLVRAYVTALTEEPRLRSYLAASMVDDLGVAVSTWGMNLLTAQLFTDQRQRAALAMPMLLCFLAGSLVAGPIADWVRTGPLSALARWRWKLVVWGRIAETISLAAVVFLARGGATLHAIMPYFFVSAFMKTGLRPTRQAFEVDLLQREETQVDAAGNVVLDERGQPRMYKIHLLSFGAMTSALRTLAVLGGLFAGNWILSTAHGQYSALFAVDVLTNLAFIGIVIYFCHPEFDPRDVRLGELVRRGEHAPAIRGLAIVRTGVAEFGRSFVEVFRFLRGREQRPLIWLLCGAWMVEVVNEFYDGGMIVIHVLHGTPDDMRHAQIAWKLVSVTALALIPALSQRVRSLGRIFLATMLIDGLVISMAGRCTAIGTAAAVMPFAALMSTDHALTLTSDSLSSLAQNSVSSAALRGRIAATYALIVIVSDIGAEATATAVSEAIGIPRMLIWIGFTQVALVAFVAVMGGRALWNFGLRSESAPTSVPEVALANAS